MVGSMTNQKNADSVVAKCSPGYLEYQFSDSDTYVTNGYLSDALRAKGVMPLVVLECEEGKPIVFGKKQITSIHDLVVTPEDIEFLLEKIDNLNRTVDQLNYHYRNQ